MFITALSEMQQNKTKYKGLIKKTWYIYSMRYFSAIKNIQ